MRQTAAGRPPDAVSSCTGIPCRPGGAMSQLPACSDKQALLTGRPRAGLGHPAYACAATAATLAAQQQDHTALQQHLSIDWSWSGFAEVPCQLTSRSQHKPPLSGLIQDVLVKHLVVLVTLNVHTTQLPLQHMLLKDCIGPSGKATLVGHSARSPALLSDQAAQCQGCDLQDRRQVACRDSKCN